MICDQNAAIAFHPGDHRLKTDHVVGEMPVRWIIIITELPIPCRRSVAGIGKLKPPPLPNCRLRRQLGWTVKRTARVHPQNKKRTTAGKNSISRCPLQLFPLAESFKSKFRRHNRLKKRLEEEVARQQQPFPSCPHRFGPYHIESRGNDLTGSDIVDYLHL